MTNKSDVNLWFMSPEFIQRGEQEHFTPPVRHQSNTELEINVQQQVINESDGGFKH